MLYRLLLGLLVLSPLWGMATHNRAGEITFRHLSASTYEITVTTYTKFQGVNPGVDRCFVLLKFGDGTQDSIARTNGGFNATGPCGLAAQVGVNLVGVNIRKNEYTTTHTFPGPGSFILSMEDPNRNGGIQNMDGSSLIPFYIQTQLVIEFGTVSNNSPVLLNDPIDQACFGQPFYHNPGAVDPEGDQLVYSLVPCRGANGTVISTYELPHLTNPDPNNTLSIDPNTGLLTWDSPNQLGEFNVCILIQEFRNGTPIGSVVRDMQITVNNCNNTPPAIDPVGPLCVTAGDLIQENIVASDNETGLTLSASGEPFNLTVSPAAFPAQTTTDPSLVVPFEWQTACDHVRLQPYRVVFKAEDLGPIIRLVNFQTLEIQVVAPAPQNLVLSPVGNAMTLSWDPNACSQAIGYSIYRRNGAFNFTPANCETGVPAYTGYQQIGTVSGWSTTNFTDDDNGNGLVHGQEYCYLVVANFADGAESYASVEICAELKRDLPIITRASVLETATTTGKVAVQWAPPTELDASIWPPPYRYVVYRAAGLGGNFPTSYVGETGSFNDPALGDTILVDSNLNTESQAHSYRIELLSGVNLVGSTKVASTPFLTTLSQDKSIDLSWEAAVPWTNQSYVVFEYDLASNTIIDTLDTVDSASYAVTELVNGQEYCYLIQTIGSYTGGGLLDPVLNFSQVTCAIPEDRVPPCPPLQPLIQTDCDLDENRLNWVSPVGQCANSDDIAGYRIYYAPVLGQPLQLIADLAGADQEEIVFSNLTSLAGCYGITSYDFVGNESEFGEVLCTDNCPTYELPNVFTPGSDQQNDLFVPFPYKFVERIDLVVYNRWGREVFRTEEPGIFWEGVDQESGRRLESGTYFYTCTVYEIRLTGLEPRILKGYVQILREDQIGPSN